MTGLKEKKKTEKKEQKIKKEIEPEYVDTLLGTKMINYHVYYRTARDKIFNFILMMVCGCIVGYIFFGNLALDAYGRKTMLTHILNIVIPLALGFILVVVYAPIQTKNLKKKRDALLKSQFRDLLDSLVNSLTSGKNVQNSFEAALADLRMQHSKNAYIVSEVELMISGMSNNIGIENLLIDFGRRSGIEDITNFGITFQTCYRKGGNIKQVVIKTNEIIGSKMQMEEELITKISSNVNEQYLMLVMPVIIVAVIKGGNDTMAANFASPVGIITSIISLAVFVGAYLIGCKLVEVKI